MTEVPVSIAHARIAMHNPKKPLCIVCRALGRDIPATSVELHSCNDRHHVSQLRNAYRWARNAAQFAAGTRLSA